MSTDPKDPFAHLHDEGYEVAFDTPRADHRTMVFVGGRQRHSLNGTWRFVLDLFDEGLRQRWFADEPGPPETWAVPRDYDASMGDEVDVPACWTAVKPEWRFFEGGAWYTRIIDTADFDTRGRTILRVGAAAQVARVFLNGRLLAAHRGGSTPFFVEMTDHLRDGANRLQIQVDNRRDVKRVPMRHIDWFNHGGIHRDVDILIVPRVFIADAGIALAPGSDGTALAIDVTLSDPVDGAVEVQVPALSLTATVPIHAGHGTATVAARPHLWSPEDPYLYLVSFAFGEDRVTDRVGFRDIRVAGERILLNGRDVWLRGVCVHEDDVALGRVTSDEDIRCRFRHARELGCNFLRLAHYPHHERVAEIADEVGLLLWEEIPVYWGIDFADPAVFADAENQLLELIRRDRNRASVILWGVGNENADTDQRLAFMGGLAEAARRADPTRLVTAACLIDRAKFRIEDRLTDKLDVVGVNEYFGWYEPDSEDLRTVLANSLPGRPVIISETGADAVSGMHGSADAFFTEERQAAYYRQQFAILRDFDGVRGVCPWLLYDFRSMRRQTAFQQGFNRKGLIAEDKRTKKAAFDVVAEEYRRIAEGQNTN
jgi:beta-glucuronidase